MPSNNFRDHLLPLDHQPLVEARTFSAREFGAAARTNPVVGPLIAEWDKRAQEPFFGITTDGRVEMGLFHIAEEGAPADKMLNASEALLTRLSTTDRKHLVYAIDAVE